MVLNKCFTSWLQIGSCKTSKKVACSQETRTSNYASLTTSAPMVDLPRVTVKTLASFGDIPRQGICDIVTQSKLRENGKMTF